MAHSAHRHGHSPQRPFERPFDDDDDEDLKSYVIFEKKRYYEDLFFYPMPFFGTLTGGAYALAPGAVFQTTLQIDSDAHFKVMKISGQTFLAGAATPYLKNAASELSMTLTDGSTGRSLTFADVPFDSITGDGELPALLPLFRVFKMKATIKVTVTNFSTANTYNNTRLTWWGTKLFPADDD